MDAKVRFKEPGTVIHLNGQQIHSGNLTQETYEWLLSWSKDFEVHFVPLEETKPPKNGKAKEE